ncbi:MAG: hypothetical protein WC139_12120 [Candidatus Kapaibacterium sp.]
MPQVIDGDSLLKNIKGLPTEAFFVDTNIVIAYKDPFAAALKNPSLEKYNDKVSELLDKLKSEGFKAYSTLSVVLEYYKYIQVNFYKVYKSSATGKETFSLDSEDFKKLKTNDSDFITKWKIYLESFKKPFKKNIIIIDKTLIPKNVLDSFEGTKIDFGDHLLYEIVKTYPKYKCIFTNDLDFYSIDDDDLYIITFNKGIIRKAKTDKKLFNL